MKISLEWLKELVKIDVSPQKLADKLTMAGTEVSAIEYHGKNISDVVVGKIKHMERHPSKDDVFICQVDTGEKLIQVVTRANNLRVGDKVPVALHGATLPGNITVEKRELHGVESFGMLCSTIELGISSEATGVMVLNKEAALGEDIKKIIGVAGTVIEADVLPNRPDCMSMVGIAREVSAVFNKPLRVPVVKVRQDKMRIQKEAKVIVKDGKACPRYMARMIKGVKIKESPKWMQARLVACGMRPINAVVDVINYLLLELGQPMHAFDFSKINDGTIIVRNARKDEKLKTLDGEDRHLSPDILVISDPRSALAIAGIMGGEDSSVVPSTKDILIESAYFDPMSIHRAERKQKLRTESSIRFEKGVDWQGVETALDRAAQMISEICGGKVLKGKIDVKGSDRKPKRITLRVDRVKAVLGTRIESKNIFSILTGLGFVVSRKGSNTLNVEVPLYRAGDVEREIDLIEEVARIYGYDEIKSSIPKIYVVNEGASPKEKLLTDIRCLLADYGMNEAQTYSMLGEDEFKKMGMEMKRSEKIDVLNAISEDMGVMRPSLLPNLFNAVRYNQNRQVSDVSVFEIGKVYFKKPEGLIERSSLAAVVAGQVCSSYEGNKETADFYYLKRIVEEIAALLNVNCAFLRTANPVFHPGKAADISIGGKDMGSIGELHPDVAISYELKDRMLVLELDLETLFGLKRSTPLFKDIPIYPSVKRDIAMIAPRDIESKRIIDVILEIGKPLIGEVKLFDRYSGSQVKEGFCSLAYSLTYRASDRTLSDEEVNGKQDLIIRKLEENLHIEVRK